MINFLKSFIRKIHIQSKLRKFDKFHSKETDHKFDYVSRLRTNGIFLDPNFFQKSNIAQKILSQFDAIDSKIINNIIESNYDKSGVKSFKNYLTDFFNKEDLLRFAYQEIILNEIKQYFGFAPHLRYVSVWLDHGVSNINSQDTQLFHRDSDDLYLIKIFFYLTNVDMTNGPFQYIEKSHKNSWKDYKIDILNKKFGNEIFSGCANRGSLIICDTNGFHRGLKIEKKNYRVLLTINYTSSHPKHGFLKEIIQ